MYSAVDVLLIVIVVIIMCEFYRLIDISRYKKKINQYKDVIQRLDKIIYGLTKDNLNLKQYKNNKEDM